MQTTIQSDDFADSLLTQSDTTTAGHVASARPLGLGQAGPMTVSLWKRKNSRFVLKFFIF